MRRIERHSPASSQITLSSGSYTQMSPPLLDESEQEVLDTTLETAHQEIFKLKSQLGSARKLISELHEERRSHMQIISDFSANKDPLVLTRTITLSNATEEPPTVAKEAVVNAPSTSFA